MTTAGRQLRFGDNVFGLTPHVDAVFDVDYRVGVGVSGNVGAEAIHHVVEQPGLAIAARGRDRDGPQPAAGLGRHRARERRRAVQLRRAGRVPSKPEPGGHRGRLRGNRGASRDRPAGRRPLPLDRQLAHGVHLDRPGGAAGPGTGGRGLDRRVRRARSPRPATTSRSCRPHYVPLGLSLEICVDARPLPPGRRGSRPGDAHERPRAARSAGVLPPRQFTFGQPLYLSRSVCGSRRRRRRRLGRRARGSGARRRRARCRRPDQPSATSTAARSRSGRSRSLASTTTRTSRRTGCSGSRWAEASNGRRPWPPLARRTTRRPSSRTGLAPRDRVPDRDVRDLPADDAPTRSLAGGRHRSRRRCDQRAVPPEPSRPLANWTTRARPTTSGSPSSRCGPTSPTS